MTKFFLPEIVDRRILYASEYLEKHGFLRVDSFEKADFVLLGVNPKDFTKYTQKLVFAGNVCSNNVADYTKDEAFAIENAYLTAEGAIALACNTSDISLINSKVLILGYGRIARALHKYLGVLTTDITICARSDDAKSLAISNNARAIDFSKLKYEENVDFVFNTVAHPVINEAELRAMKKDVTILDLASFPGGVDAHFAKSLNLNLIIARGLPAKYSPKTAGIIVGKTVEKMIPRKE